MNCFIARMRSIQQSVQNGQFTTRRTCWCFKIRSGTFPAFLMCGQQWPFAGDGVGAAFSLSFEINAPLGFAGSFLRNGHAAAPAFKRTYIGQCAETLRPSNQSHVPSAAWAQRQLGLRAFSIHDEARFSAIHARLHWLPLLVEHSLAVVEAREHTIQTCAKTRTEGALIHYKRVGHRSPPPRYKSVMSGCAPPVTNGLLHLHGYSQSGKVSKMVNSSVALLRSRRIW